MNSVRQLLIAFLAVLSLGARGGTSPDVADLWWSGPVESGWGMSVFQHEDRLFNVWFVYDSSRRPTWFVQSSGAWNPDSISAFAGPIYRPSSAPYFAYDASRFQPGLPVGSGTTSFQGGVAAHTTFVANDGPWGNALGAGWGKSMVRQPFGQGVASPIQGVADLWWGGPSQDGWGLAIHEESGTLFMVWFTYGDDGMPTWFVMPGGHWTAAGTYAGKVYRTTGPYWGDETFDASKVKVTEVGGFEIRFDSPRRARLDATIQGNLVGLDLVRQPF